MNSPVVCPWGIYPKPKDHLNPRQSICCRDSLPPSSLSPTTAAPGSLPLTLCGYPGHQQSWSSQSIFSMNLKEPYNSVTPFTHFLIICAISVIYFLFSYIIDLIIQCCSFSLKQSLSAKGIKRRRKKKKPCF